MAPEDRPTGPPAGESPPPVPSWVKYLLLGLATAAVLAVLVMLLVGGDHGPGRHLGSLR
ncbi:MAG TPA: hypothetical protein VNT31_00370 [Nocardioides sp.]|nr:hypothetical protein [Nocardioides sp.]